MLSKKLVSCRRESELWHVHAHIRHARDHMYPEHTTEWKIKQLLLDQSDQECVLMWSLHFPYLQSVFLCVSSVCPHCLCLVPVCFCWTFPTQTKDFYLYYYLNTTGRWYMEGVRESLLKLTESHRVRSYFTDSQMIQKDTQNKKRYYQLMSLCCFKHF